ncbi:MAG TPA: hypothetical protein VFY93_04555 [Planctomycetota bacterium]|nr:hypothetical protein [Planctomycetota bacterium]
MVRLLVLLLLASLAAPEEKWIAFGEREWKTGSRRLVVNESGFRFFDGDKLLAEGRLPQLPFDVQVLAGGPGAVLFEKYAAIGQGDTLSFLGADGKLRWRLTPADVIPGGPGGPAREAEEPFRRRPWWVDETRGKAVLVGRDGVLFDVDLETGKPARAPNEVILTAFAQARVRDDALRVAIDLQPEGLRPAAEKLLGDRSLAPYDYLLAAVAAETAGGAAVTQEAWDGALEADVHIERRRDVVEFAGAHIADVSIVAATALRGDFGKAAIRALSKRGATGEIAGLITNGSIDPSLRAYAAEALGRQAPEKALEAIDKEMEDADAEQGGALLAAAIATGAPDLERRLQHHESVLLRILDKETADLSWLAGYFKGRPTSEAVQPLLRALAQHKHDPALRRRLIAALKPCSGEDFGDDADAWISALAKRR